MITAGKYKGEIKKENTSLMTKYETYNKLRMMKSI